MIGNDIIDLSLAKIQSNWQRSGFLEKQFTNQEIDLIRKSANPFLMVWRFWSMKEAAYKIVVQQQNKRFFAPKKFECRIVSESEGEVNFESQTFISTTTTTSKYIYTSIGEPTFRWIGLSTDTDGMLEIIERQIGVFSTQTEIKKNAFGVPQIYELGRQISRFVTKTHHGNFEAVEYTLI